MTLQQVGALLAETEPKEGSGALAARLTALAQLAEALVCYEQVSTLRPYAQTWLQSRELSTLHKSGLITFAPISDTDLADIQTNAVSTFKAYSRSRPFQAFVSRVLNDTYEGAAIRCARNYNNVQDHPNRAFWNAEYDGDVHAFQADELDSIWEDSSRSIIPAVINVLGAGAVTYKSIAAITRSAYLPFCVRIPLCLYDDIRPRTQPMAASSLALAAIKDVAAAELTQALKPESAYFIDFELPPVLSIVLSSAKSRRDIISRILEIRASPRAKTFRGLVTAIGSAVELGDVSTLTRAIAEIRREAKGVLGAQPEPLGRVKLGVTGFSFDIPVRIPDRLRTLVSSRTRSCLYQTLLSRFPTIAGMEANASRLFGCGLDLRDYRDLMHPVRDSPE